MKYKKNTNHIDVVQLSILSSAIFYLFYIIFSNINSGYELGDHGFYLLHLQQPEQITHTLTHFGIVWNFLIGDHGISTNRIINIIIIGFSVILVTIIPIFLGEGRKFRSALAGALVGTAVSSTYFGSFILDPSYNSISLICVLFGVASISISLEMELRGKRIAALFFAALAGAIIAILLFSKASTAISLSIFMVSVSAIAAFSLRSVSLFSYFILCGLLGFLVFITFFHLNTSMVIHVEKSFSLGLKAYASGGTHSTKIFGIETIEKIYYLFRVLLFALIYGGWIIALPALVGLATTYFTRNFSAQSRFGINVMVIPSITIITIIFIMVESNLATIKNQMMTVFLLGVVISVVLWNLVKLTVSEHVLMAGSLLAPLIIIFGTTNSYHSQILNLGPGLSLLPAWITLPIAPKHIAIAARRIVFALATFSVALSANSALNFPYRLGGDLSSARVPVLFTDSESLNVTPPVAEFIKAMRLHSYPEKSKSEAPTVFDLTGQLPIAVFLLNGRVPGAAWFLDAFGSNFSRAVFADLDDRIFPSGWILVRQNNDGSLDKTAPHFLSFLERLERLGVNFEEQFQRVATVPAPNWGRADETLTVLLYKPR